MHAYPLTKKKDVMTKCLHIRSAFSHW